MHPFIHSFIHAVLTDRLTTSLMRSSGGMKRNWRKKGKKKKKRRRRRRRRRRNQIRWCVDDNTKTSGSGFTCATCGRLLPQVNLASGSLPIDNATYCTLLSSI